MNFPEKIKGERITLERAKPTFELATELFELADASRESLLPWLPWALTTKTPEDEFDYLLNWCQKHWETGAGYAYVIRENNAHKAIGVIDFVTIEEVNRRGEIGYWLGSEFVGHGYMLEAVKLLEAEIFAQGFNSIKIGNDTRNTRSANVAKRAGYHLDGVLRQNRWSKSENCFVSSNVWSKLKEEFEK